MVTETDSMKMRRWFSIGIVALVLACIAMVLLPFASPMAWAAILGFLMSPLQERLTLRFKGRRSLAAGVLVALTPIAIFVPLSLIALAFANQVASLATTVQQNAGGMDLQSWLDPDTHPRVAGFVQWMGTRLGVEIADVENYLRENVQGWAGTLAKSSGLVFLNMAGVLLNFFLMLFVLFFTLRDGAEWFRRITALLPLGRARRTALFTRLGKVTRAVVYGCGLTALAQGTLVTIGFVIARLPGSIVFGVLAALLALLPFGGAALVWLPAMLYLFVVGKFGWAIFMLVWGGVVSTSDNFIRPIIISRYTPVPTLLVFLGVIGGVAAFGLIGFIAGPVVLVLATELLRYAEGSLKRAD